MGRTETARVLFSRKGENKFKLWSCGLLSLYDLSESGLLFLWKTFTCVETWPLLNEIEFREFIFLARTYFSIKIMARTDWLEIRASAKFKFKSNLNKIKYLLYLHHTTDLQRIRNCPINSIDYLLFNSWVNSTENNRYKYVIFSLWEVVLKRSLLAIRPPIACFIEP